MSENSPEPILGEWITWCVDYVDEIMKWYEMPKKAPQVVTEGRKAA